jgi:hypothetical protein
VPAPPQHALICGSRFSSRLLMSIETHEHLIKELLPRNLASFFNNFQNNLTIWIFSYSRDVTIFQRKIMEQEKRSAAWRKQEGIELRFAEEAHLWVKIDQQAESEEAKLKKSG